jgi:uronate dehydrogenase
VSLRERIKRLITAPPRNPERRGKPRILLTGSAGRIGLALRTALGEDYNFRCMDLRASPGCAEALRAQVADASAVRAAMVGTNAVVHLASSNGGGGWQAVQRADIQGTYALFEEASRAGVSRFIFASTNHVSGGWEREGLALIYPDMPVRPDSLFAVGKVFGEALGRYCAEHRGMEVACLRIGSYRSSPSEQELRGRVVRTWVSSADLVQLVRLCLERELTGFQVFYAVSDNRGRYWDITNAQAILGYQPNDDASDLLR